jgi:hypothetical protein
MTNEKPFRSKSGSLLALNMKKEKENVKDMLYFKANLLAPIFMEPFKSVTERTRLFQALLGDDKGNFLMI